MRVMKNYIGLLMASFFVVSFVFMSAAFAEVETFVGTGIYAMAEDETMDYAKEQAKLRAEREAQSQAYLYIRNQSKSENAVLTEDEIITITAGIMTIVDVKYTLLSDDDGSIVIRAQVTANIDTNDIPEWLKKLDEENDN